MLIADRNAWLMSFKMYIAAMAAMYISQASGLERPYWAMMTVYIVFNPALVGASNAKGIHRSLGTMLGCVAVVAIVPNLVQTPLMMCLALCIWMTVCLFISQLSRTPGGYVFMLAGYTASFISFPSVNDATNIFSTVIYRSEEIMLGALMAILSASIIFPPRVRVVMTTRVDSWLGSAKEWTHQILSSEGPSHAARNRLAGELSQMDMFIDGLKRDDRRRTSDVSILDRLGDRLKVLLPALSSIQDGIYALSAREGELPHYWKALLEECDQWITATDIEHSHEELERLLQRVDSLMLDDADDLSHIINNALCLRMVELLKLWWDCFELRGALDRSAQEPARKVRLTMLIPRFPRNYHFDISMITFSSLAAGMSLMAYCVVWIGIGWPEGANGAMIGAVVASFFAAQDDPTPGMFMFLSGILLASLIAAIALFGVMPMVDSYGLLAVVLGMVLLPLGLLMTRPSSFIYGLTVIVNFLVQLNIRDSYSADVQVFINSTLGMVIGIIFVIVVTRLVRSLGADITARRLVVQSWGILAAAAAGRGREDRNAFTAQMFDLLALLAPRLAAAGNKNSSLASVDMLREVRLGLNILQIRRAHRQLPLEERLAIESILDGIADYFRTLVKQRRSLPIQTALIEELDDALYRLNTMPVSTARNEALVGIYGIRRTFAASEENMSKAD